MAEMEEHVRATGGCLCGAVRYEVRGALREIIACHCTQCRRMSGHFISATATRRANLEIVGKSALQWFRASPEAERGFCATCGSTLFWQRDDADYTSIFAGSLDSPTGLHLAAHIFVGDKGDYYEIADGLPRSDTHSHDVQLPDE